MELPLGSVFEAPTIAALAALIERLGSESHDPLSVMLPLRNRQDRASAAVLHSSDRRRQHGLLQPPAASGSRRFRCMACNRAGCGVARLPGSVEEIAADYLAQIRVIQPEGPYRLIGRSLGGLIGHAIAGQMQSQGLQVEMLAMIDSYLFMAGKPARLRTEAEEVGGGAAFPQYHPLAPESTPQTLPELTAVLLHPGMRARFHRRREP